MTTNNRIGLVIMLSAIMAYLMTMLPFNWNWIAMVIFTIGGGIFVIDWSDK